MKRFVIILAILFIVIMSLLFIFSLRNEDDIKLAGKTKIKFQLQWLDQAQFAGFYVAKFKNFYNEEGLDVEIVPGGFITNPIQLIQTKIVDIALVTGNKLLVAKAENHDLKAFGTVFYKSIACFMSKAESKILIPKDFVGKKVGVYRGYDTEHLLYAMLHKNSIPKEEVNIIDASALVAFKKDELDVFPSYIINEPIQMELENYKIHLITPDNEKIQFYSDTFFSTTKYWKENKEIIERFLRASARGWNYAKNNHDETINIMYDTRYNLSPDSTRTHQLKMLKESCKFLLKSTADYYFDMDKTRWDAMEQILYEIGILKGTGYVDKLCDFQMIKNAQKE